MDNHEDNLYNALYLVTTGNREFSGVLLLLLDMLLNTNSQRSSLYKLEFKST